MKLMSIQKLFKRGSTKLFLFVYIILAGLIKPVVAELQIDITQGTVKPMPIAISDLTGSTGQEKRIGEDIASVIAALSLVRSSKRCVKCHRLARHLQAQGPRKHSCESKRVSQELVLVLATV